MAQRLGGTRVRGSGSVPMRRGDVRLGSRFLGEVKFTERKYLSLRYADLMKIERDALAIGCRPFFLVEFRPYGTEVRGSTWIAFPEYVVAEWLEEAKS